MEFGLFFFANDTSGAGQTGKYDLIFEAARWADQNGICLLYTSPSPRD